MKKIFHFAILLIVGLGWSSTSKAQGCAGITVTTFPLNPQTGTHNYFGINVTLDRIYGQNVTVYGYIYSDQHDDDQTHPFSLTVFAGGTTNSTAATFYETGIASDASVVVVTITPDIVTNSGNTYSTQCYLPGITPDNVNNPYDYVGQQHNQLLDYFVANTPTISNRGDVATNINSYYGGTAVGDLLSYANSIGLRYSFDSAQNVAAVCLARGYSSEFAGFVNTLTSHVNDSTAEFFTIRNNFITAENAISASSTLTSTEKQILLSAASVARFSLYYWGQEANTDAWDNYTGQNIFSLEYNSRKSEIYTATDILTSTQSTNTPSLMISDVSDYAHGPFINMTPGRDDIQSNIAQTRPSTALKYYKFSWRSVGKKDLDGAIQGGVAGALVGGTVTLGTLTVASWLGGAIGWGAGSSISGAFGQLTGWW